MHHIWSLSDRNGTRTYNHLVRKQYFQNGYDLTKSPLTFLIILSKYLPVLSQVFE